MGKAAVLALFLSVNLLLFAHVSGCATCPSPPKPKPKPKPNPKTKPSPNPCPPPSLVPKETCPRDTLKLGVCADLLGGLVGLVMGTPPITPCCALLKGLADLEAAVCLCTVIKTNVLEIVNLDIPLSVSLLLNVCSKKVPPEFQCA